MRIKDIQSASQDEILQNLLDTLVSLKNGHFTARMTEGFPGIHSDIARALNDHLDMLTALRAEHRRLMEEVGVTGRLGGQMEVAGLSGAWKEMNDDVNTLGVNITCQFRDGANVVRDILHGDPAARMTCPNIQGEFAEFKQNLNKLAAEYEHRAADVSAT
jgi:hypothetical protein